MPADTMKKTGMHSLRSMLTESAPIRHLPAGVVRQLVGYYRDWRRSRDILNDADDTTASSRRLRLLTLPTLSGSPRTYRTQ